MDEKEMMDAYIRSLKKIIEFLKNNEKCEIWTVNEFLMNFNIKFNIDEIKKSNEEPSDIIFRNASFQIKAIYDENRKMIEEYKIDLKKAEKAKEASSSIKTLNLKEYAPKDISIQEIANLINVKLENYILSPEQYQKIDMLFYFNKFFYNLKNNLCYSFPNETLWKKWRSISMVKNNGVNFILWARNDAPDFVRKNIGRTIKTENFI